MVGEMLLFYTTLNYLFIRKTCLKDAQDFHYTAAGF